jgi:hypothetical protein
MSEEGKDKLLCPQILLDHAFKLPSSATPPTRVTTWRENGIREMMTPSMQHIVRLLEAEISMAGTCMPDSPTGSSGGADQRIDFITKSATTSWAPIELKSTFTTGSDSWNSYLFSGTAESVPTPKAIMKTGAGKISGQVRTLRSLRCSC